MKSIAIMGATLLLCGLTASAQEEQPFHSQISVSAIGAFTYGVNGGGIQQTASSTGGVLASYAYMFNRYNGIQADYSHMQFTQQFTSGSILNTGVQTDLDEFTASYVVRFPVKRVVPFLSAGTGAVVFNPSVSGLGFLPATQARAAFVYGAGVDMKCTDHIFFRVAYRGLVYLAPDFDVVGLQTNALTHVAEPTAGFGFRW